MSNPHPRQQCNGGGIAPEPTWIDRLLSATEQHRIVRLLHDAGFPDASPMASIFGLVRGAAGPNGRKQKTVRDIVEACIDY